MGFITKNGKRINTNKKGSGDIIQKNGPITDQACVSKNISKISRESKKRSHEQIIAISISKCRSKK